MPPRPAIDRFFCRLPRSISGLTNLGRWVDHVSGILRLSASAEYAFRLCVEEAVSNVVFHGGDMTHVQQTIAVSLKAKPDILLIRIADPCAPFDPVSGPLPELRADLPGGHGLRLMRRFACSIRYRRLSDQNQLILTVARS